MLYFVSAVLVVFSVTYFKMVEPECFYMENVCLMCLSLATSDICVSEFCPKMCWVSVAEPTSVIW